MIPFAQHTGQTSPTPTLPGPAASVGARAHIEKLQDEIRELAAQLEGKKMELCMAMHASAPDPNSRNAFRLQADCHRRTMQRLIGERRSAVVADMEQARGLAA